MSKPWDHGGKTRHERGYGSAWEKLRAQVLAAEPLCRPCREATPRRTTIAVAVDHIRSKGNGGTDDLSNLRPICDDCHRRKTIEDRGHQSTRGCGHDGWPL